MRLARIEIEGFKSFAEYTEFSFNLDNGLYFVTGENQLEPNLGANGAGKSALFEAICWCLYGKTSTNLKANNIVNWNDKGCSVALTFDNNDIIQRDQSPNKLTINDNPVTQEELEKHLGYLGFESFLYSTFISQFSSKFFDLSPADKMVVFSDIMAETLYPWELRSTQAKAKADQTNAVIKNIEIDISRLQGNLDSLNNTDYSTQIKEFERNKKEEITKLKAHKKDINDQIVDIKESTKELMKEKAKLELANKKVVIPNKNDEKELIDAKYNKLFDVIKTSLEVVRDKQNEVSEYLFKNKAEYNSLQKEKDKINAVEGKPTCPTCLQKVDKKLLISKEKEIQQRLLQLEREYSHAKSEAVKLNKDFSELQEKLDEKRQERDQKIYELQESISKVEKKHSEILTQMRVTQTTIDGHSTNLKSKTDQLKKLDDMIFQADSRVNDYVELENKRKESIAKVTNTINDNLTDLGLTKKESDAFSYWVKGFKEIRLLLMYDALKEFEVSVNNALSKFGMGDWNVKLDIDQENKSGTVRKGFSVLVESPNHNGFVPFEVWSGGEGQRLRMAGTIGLMDLIQSKRQVDFGLEIFDEPTAWLSDKGVDDLLQTLYYRAKENEKKIFLIDHKQLNTFGGFHGIVTVKKDEKGSHIFC